MDLIRRYQLASEYLVLETKLNSISWKNLFSVYKEAGLSLPKKMILIHPLLISKELKSKGHGVNEIEDLKTFIYGSRNFKSKINHGITCQSESIWGYRCCFEETEIHRDHYFPFSKGGPTDVNNQLFLCKTHNELKGSDLHGFNWEEGEPLWFPKTLSRIVQTFNIDA